MIASLLSPLSPSSSHSQSQSQPQLQPQKGRISQSLPSVKCSTCHQPVALTELGDHACKGTPPVPQIQKPSMSPAAATSLLPDRLQGRVASPSPSSPAQSNTRSPPSPPKTADSSHHQRFPSSASARLRQNIGISAPKSPTAQSFKSSPLARSESENNVSLGPPKPLEDPARARTLSNATPGSSVQTPPNARPSISDIPPNGPPRIGTPLSNNPRGPPPPNPLPGIPPPRIGTPGPPIRNGTPGPPPRIGTPGPPIRNGTPGPPPPINLSRGPPPQMLYNNGPPPPQSPGINFPSRPGPPGAPLPPPNNRGPPPPPSIMPPPHATGPVPGPPIPMGPGSIIRSPDAGPISPDQAFVHPAERGIDTKSGGAAGMAGVGRRGFAAAARAAMLVQQQGPYRQPPAPGFPPYPQQPFYAGRPGAPQFLDIDAASRSADSFTLATETPPLSAGSGYSSHSPGPSSPLPQTEFMSQPLPPKILEAPSPSTGLSSPSTGLSSAPAQSLSSTKPKLTATIPERDINSPTDNTTDTKDISPGGIMSALSPLSARLPFFEKFKNKIPNTSNAYDTTEQSSSSNSRSNSNRSIDRSRGNTSSPSRGGRVVQEESLYNPAVARSLSSSTNASAYTSASARRRPEPKQEPPSPIDSESEYGGLAYADSTDYEDNDEEEALANMRKGRDDPPTLPPASRSMRSGSNASADSSRLGFSSVSGHSDRDRDREIGRDRLRDRRGDADRDERGRDRGSEVSSHRGDLRLGKAATPRPGHHRDHSVESSYSSASSVKGGRGQEVLARSRSNSSAVAQALGLSQTPPSEYGRLGGPGVMGGRPRRDERSGSVSSSGSAKRAGIIASRDDTSASDRREREREREMEREREWEKMEREKRREPERSREPLSKNGSQRSQGGSDSSNLRRMDTASSDNSRASETSRRKDPRDLALNLTSLKLNGTYRDDNRDATPGPSKPYRSNTIQSPVSPENKPIKLPTRSLTSPAADRDNFKGLDSSRNRTPKAPTTNTATAKTPRTAVPKIKICLKCDKRVDDGRWVSVDSGGVLCERCWKNMYLPKCRRCNLPIEKQAISSSDGQLKGKYHRDCFNCHICHKPFPDKTFYVYDGKPLCAYHYHEANDSLCSAARCGQPIEGPCAISHTGDRYHPEHMTCEYEGRGGAGYRACDVRLDEYWEMDGRMLCEQHARGMSKRTRGGGNTSRDDREWGSSKSGSETGSVTDDEERWVQNSRAMRRVTRFIDLGNEGGGLR